MADIDAIDDDQKWFAKILENRKKTDPQGVLFAERDGKSKKGISRLTSRSWNPILALRGYSKLENKEDSPSMLNPKTAQLKARSRTQSTKSNSARTSLQSNTSTETSSVRAADCRTVNIEKHKPNTKRKERMKVQDKTVFRKRRSAPELTGTPAIQTFLTIEKRPKPQRRSYESVRRKISNLDIVPEKPRSKSYDVGAVKTSTKTIAKQNTKKLILRNFPGKWKDSRGSRPVGRCRSRSYSPRYETKNYSSLEEMISEKVALFNRGEKSEVSKLASIKNVKSKTMKLATGALKKAPGGSIFTGKKNVVVPLPGNPK